jgi:hypothetical protein
LFVCNRPSVLKKYLLFITRYLIPYRALADRPLVTHAWRA